MYFYLDKINSPADLKKLDKDSLDTLCSEIRHKLIYSVSMTGGHLASNLGTVELTVAIHKTFNAPEDTIIWDVSHQAYTHKILTGRSDDFSLLRTEGGISGFIRPDESKYDSFYEGHAGTSVSRAAGVALANKAKGSKSYAVAVIGDGSFGNGMVYEAMNHIGSTDARLIVILNDNEMSISENVGAMARYLAIIRAKPEYYRLKARTEKNLKRIPLIGKHLSQFVFKIKNDLKNIIYKSSFFEDIGFRYIGPIDGHDISTLCEAMESAKMMNRPVIIHVNTIKGKGYDFAENSPEKFHGISKFNVETGEPITGKESYSSVFADAVYDFASRDKRICTVTAAMKVGTGLDKFFKDFPDRSFDVGIAESHAFTFCSGLSGAGMIPVFAVYSSFLQRCADQIIHDGALQRLKMIIGVDRSGFVGEDGETHQGLFDVSLIQSVPNSTIYAPSTYLELKNALYNSLYKDENTVFIRYPRGSMPNGISDTSSGEPFDVSGDNDADIALITYGRLWFEALKAFYILSSENIKVKLIKLNRIKPVPNEIYDILSECNNVLFFEESMRKGGVGEVVASDIIQKNIRVNFKHIAVDGFVPHATVKSQMKKYKLDSEGIVDTVKGILI